MYCQECGKEIGDNAAFCPCCGKPTGNASDARKKSLSVVKIIGIVIIIILIAIVAILVVRKTTNKASDTEGSTTNEVTDIDKSTTKEVSDTAESITDEVAETAEPITKVSALNDIIGDWEPWGSSTMDTGSSTGSITSSYAWSYERPGLLRVEAEGITGISSSATVDTLYYAIGVDDITVQEENGIKYYIYSAESFSTTVQAKNGMGRHKIEIRLCMDEETGLLICEFNTPLDGSWIRVCTYAPAEYVRSERQRIQRELEEREERERELSVLNGIFGFWGECVHTESNTYADIYDEYERVTYFEVGVSFLQAFNSSSGVCYAVDAENITIQEENGIKYYIYPAEMYSYQAAQVIGSDHQTIDVRLHLDEETGWLICEYNTPQDGFWQQVGAFELLEAY